MPAPSVRPLLAADIDAVHEATVKAFQVLNRRFGEPVEPAGPIAASRVRIGRLLSTDAGGAWVAAWSGAREVGVEWITSLQGLEAGLELRMDVGAVFLGGDVGPFAPYLPGGAYL